MKELNPEYFFFKLPIYKPILINEGNQEAFELFIAIGSVDNTIIHADTECEKEYYFEGYNPHHKTDSTFNVLNTRQRELFGDDIITCGGVEQIKLVCRRYGDIFRFFINYDIDKKTLMKIGQYPSVADFHIYQIKRFNKLLSKEKLREFSKAFGLAANGVGIGSFVYLRRIFEYLIFDAFNKNKLDIELTESEFLFLKMDKKIRKLKLFSE